MALLGCSSLKLFWTLEMELYLNFALNVHIKLPITIRIQMKPRYSNHPIIKSPKRDVTIKLCYQSASMVGYNYPVANFKIRRTTIMATGILDEDYKGKY